MLRCVVFLLALSGLLTGQERHTSLEEFNAMAVDAKKDFLIKVFSEWEKNSQNIIAKTTSHIRYGTVVKNGLIDVDMDRKPSSSWRCGIFRLNGQFGKTKIETTSFPVGITHRSRTSCLPSASSNTENFNRFAFWLKAEFDEAIHYPFFETERYIDGLSFRGLSDEQYIVVEHPIDSQNESLEVKRTMWLAAANGFLPARMKTSVTRETRVGKSSIIGNIVVSRFKLVNGVVVPVEFLEYVTRPNMRLRPIPLFHTKVNEIKIRRKP